MPLSAFRALERLPGTLHPRPSTGCSSRAAAGTSTPGSSRTTTSTGRRSARRLAGDVPEPDDVARRSARGGAGATPRPRGSGRGSGPGASTASLEGRPRPVTPSSFSLIAPGGGALRRRRFGARYAGRSPSTSCLREHVDIPFWNDPGSASSNTVPRATRSGRSMRFARSSHSSTLRREEAPSRL